MRIAMLNVPNGEDRYSRLGRCVTRAKGEYLYPPTELLTLAGWLRSQGQAIVFCDGAVEGAERCEALAREADMVVTMVGLVSYGADRAFLERIRRRAPRCRTVVFGQGASFATERYLECADAVVSGEPERPVLELAQGVAAPRGVSLWMEGRRVINREPHPVENLDELGLPARDLVDNRVYRHALLAPFASVYSARGCPYRCTFCTTAGYAPRFRARSPEHVAAELEELRHRHGMRNFAFMDDTFTLSEDRVGAIAGEMLRRDLRMRWIALARVDRVNPALLRLMRRAGCIGLLYGLESGSQRVLDSLRKEFSLDQARRAVGWTHGAGMTAHGFFMLGCPEDDEGTMEETVRFATELPLASASFNVYTPYPGTPGHAEEECAALEELDQARALPGWRHPRLAPEEVNRQVARAYRRFYLAPRQVLRQAGFHLRHPSQLVHKLAQARHVMRLSGSC